MPPDSTIAIAHARLAFSCNEIDSYVLARLSRVDADGTTHPLSLGAVRPVVRNEDPTRGSSESGRVASSAAR